MSWYRTGTVVVTNGSKTVTGVGTLFTTAVNAGDAFALVDANLNPTGAWYEVDVVVSNTEITLKQSYAGTTGSNNQFCIFNMVGNMTTPSFAQRLATFFASFQSLIDKPTATPTAASIPIADANGDIDSGWIPATFFNKTNILGTVSHAGGVPTGAVIESGSNANGSYVKFADGTIMCWIVRQQDNPSMELFITGLYRAFIPVTFATEFINIPTIISCGLGDSGNFGFGGASMTRTTTTGTLTYYTPTPSPASCLVSYIVIGRWY